MSETLIPRGWEIRGPLADALDEAAVGDDPFKRARVMSAVLSSLCSVLPSEYYQIKNMISDPLAKLNEKIDGEYAPIAVFGDTHVGKSSLINALFREPYLLPSDVPNISTTRVPVVIQRDDGRKALDSDSQFSVEYHYRERTEFAVALVSTALRLFFPGRCGSSSSSSSSSSSVSTASSASDVDVDMLSGLPDAVATMWQSELRRPSLDLQIQQSKFKQLLAEVFDVDWEASFRVSPVHRLVDMAVANLSELATRQILCGSARAVHDQIADGVLRKDSSCLDDRCLLRKIIVRGPFPNALVADGMALLDTPGVGDGDFLGYLSVEEELWRANHAVYVARDGSATNRDSIEKAVNFVNAFAKPGLRDNLLVVVTYFDATIPPVCGATAGETEIIEELVVDFRTNGLTTLDREHLICVNSLLSMLLHDPPLSDDEFPTKLRRKLSQPKTVATGLRTDTQKCDCVRLMSALGQLLSTAFVDDVKEAILSCRDVMLYLLRSGQAWVREIGPSREEVTSLATLCQQWRQKLSLMICEAMRRNPTFQALRSVRTASGGSFLIPLPGMRVGRRLSLILASVWDLVRDWCLQTWSLAPLFPGGLSLIEASLMQHIRQFPDYVDDFDKFSAMITKYVLFLNPAHVVAACGVTHVIRTGLTDSPFPQSVCRMMIACCVQSDSFDSWKQSCEDALSKVVDSLPTVADAEWVTLRNFGRAMMSFQSDGRFVTCSTLRRLLNLESVVSLSELSHVLYRDIPLAPTHPVRLALKSLHDSRVGLAKSQPWTLLPPLIDNWLDFFRCATRDLLHHGFANCEVASLSGGRCRVAYSGQMRWDPRGYLFQYHVADLLRQFDRFILDLSVSDIEFVNAEQQGAQTQTSVLRHAFGHGSSVSLRSGKVDSICSGGVASSTLGACVSTANGTFAVSAGHLFVDPERGYLEVTFSDVFVAAAHCHVSASTSSHPVDPCTGKSGGIDVKLEQQTFCAHARKLQRDHCCILLDGTHLCLQKGSMFNGEFSAVYEARVDFQRKTSSFVKTEIVRDFAFLKLNPSAKQMVQNFIFPIAGSSATGIRWPLQPFHASARIDILLEDLLLHKYVVDCEMVGVSSGVVRGYFALSGDSPIVELQKCGTCGPLGPSLGDSGAAWIITGVTRKSERQEELERLYVGVIVGIHSAVCGTSASPYAVLHPSWDIVRRLSSL
jgi:hypothetical protein